MAGQQCPNSAEPLGRSAVPKLSTTTWSVSTAQTLSTAIGRSAVPKHSAPPLGRSVLPKHSAQQLGRSVLPKHSAQSLGRTVLPKHSAAPHALRKNVTLMLPVIHRQLCNDQNVPQHRSTLSTHNTVHKSHTAVLSVTILHRIREGNGFKSGFGDWLHGRKFYMVFLSLSKLRYNIEYYSRIPSSLTSN